jgi:hypothetical protein
MTRRDGFSRDMSRFEPDADAAERLMTGNVDIADAPPGDRAVARTLRALRAAPDGWELVGESDAVEQIAAAVVLERTVRPIRPSRRRSPRVAVLSATAVVVCALPLVGGLASAGALPEPAQDAAAAVLGKVGISVPISDPSDNRPAPASAVPGPPSTAAPSPGVAGSSPGAGAPVPDAGKLAPGSSSATAPTEDEGHQRDKGARGTRPDDESHGASKDDRAPHTRGDGGDGGNGKSNHER